MAVSSPLTSVVRHFRRAVYLADEEALSDGQLLDDFLADKDESAFEVIVRRHGPMVLGVCRRVLGNRADVDDAFQATFLVLLRKANSIRPRDRVGPWLHGVAHRTALKARSLACRRSIREQPLADRPVESTPEFDQRDWLPLLDRELNRLPEKYRAVVILCDLQGHSRRDVANRLRLSEGTLSSRLARARAILGDRLRRRGVLLSTALMAFSESASASVPVSLRSATTATIVAAASGKTAATIPAILSQGVLQTMVLSKLLKTGSLILLVVGLSVGIGSQALLGEARGQKPAVEKTAAPEKPAKPEKPGEPAVKPEKPAVGETVNGTLKSIDETKKTVTVIIPGMKGTKEAKEETFTLANDVSIVLVHGLKKGETKPGKVGDVSTGAPVNLQLTLDRKAVAKIDVHGGSVSGSVKSVDPTKNAVTLGFKGESGPIEKTIELETDGRVYLNDGFGTKTQPVPPKEGKIADLIEGIYVNIQLSGYDRTKAVRIDASGPSVNGSVTAIDLGNNTITIKSKGEGEQTFTLHKDVRFNKGKLADIAVGTGASLRLSIEDKKTVVGIYVKE